MANAKIAYITSMKIGLPTFVYHEINELRRRGLQVLIFATKYSHGLYMPTGFVYRMRPIWTILRQPEYLALFRTKYIRSLAIALKERTLIDFAIACDFAKVMMVHKITHIHCVEGLHSFGIGYYCKRLTGLKLSVTIYADGLYIPPSKALFRRALDASNTIVTICEFNKDILVNKFAVPESKVSLIPVTLDTDIFYPLNTINILIVAQFAARKGHRVLFDAIKMLGRAHVRVWVVGGKGTDLTYVDVPALAEEMGISDRIIFWGKVSEVVLRTLYQMCDIFCLPSQWVVPPEGTPIALMEAMACEKPVVSTRHAGIPEYVPEILVDEGDVSGLANALAYLIDNPEARKLQGKRNREIIIQKFSVTNTDRLINVFHARPIRRCFDETTGRNNS